MKLLNKIKELLFPIMFDDIKKEGKCPWCGKWGKDSYMDKKRRNEEWQTSNSLICDSCYKNYNKKF